MYVFQLALYDISVRIVMDTPLLAIPVPAAHVTLSQTSVVQNVLTGIDGVANFNNLPEGNYTVRADYFFATYQSPLNVIANGGAIVRVPFPHPTITVIAALAIISLASVVQIRKKRRGKLYPTGFKYFMELTHGGLPETCFATIAGNSGSGKSVLLNSLAGEHLALGKSVYITNTEYPDKIPRTSSSSDFVPKPI